MFGLRPVTMKENQKFGPPYAVLNLSKIGLRYFRIGVNASMESQERLASHLTTHPNVGWIFKAEGYFNFAIGIWAKDNAEINDISQQVRRILSPKDKIVFQSEVTRLFSFGNRPAGNKSEPMPIVDSTVHPIELSPLELDYIKLLALDSSLNRGELSRILNITAQELDQMTERLTKSGVIVGYQERIEYGGIYYKVFIDTLSRKAEDAEKKLINLLWQDGSCIYFSRSNSKYDLEFELILKDKKEITKYLDGFSDSQQAILTKNVYTNLYPLSKVANLQQIKETLLSQAGQIIDFRNSKLWYLNYEGAKAYLGIYDGNQEYFETMEKGEIDLFPEVAAFIQQENKTTSFSLIDIGSGNGLKGKLFIQALGEEHVKAYYPVDIQPIELAAALSSHANSVYAKHPTVVDIENLASRFPLKLPPNEKQIAMIFGGTYGNFLSEIINGHLKTVLGDTSMLLIAMPIVGENKSDEQIVASYRGKQFESMVFGPLAQVGFMRKHFEANAQFPEMIVQFNIENRRLVSSCRLRQSVEIFGRVFEKGTTFQLTTSWKPTLLEFQSALEKDFIIEKVFHNKDMAIALIESLKKG